MIVLFLVLPAGSAAAKEPSIIAQEQQINHVKNLPILNSINPETVEIETGTTVNLVNYIKPKGPIVLISNDGLWEEQSLPYGKSFSYTFEKEGTYTCSLKNRPEKIILKVTGSIAAETNPQALQTLGITATETDSETASSSGNSNQNEGPVAVIKAQKHEINVVIYNTITPQTVEIETGDIINWINYVKPKGPIVLTDNNGLWEDQTLQYGKSFSYTFEKAGTYTCSIKDKPEAKITVTVKDTVTKDTVTGETNFQAQTAGVAATGPAPTEAAQSAGYEKQNNAVIEPPQRTMNLAIYNTITPDAINVKAGQTVNWINFRKPKGPLILESNDGLWKEQTLQYGKSFSYTFEKPGTYTCSIKDRPEAKATVVVE